MSYFQWFLNLIGAHLVNLTFLRIVRCTYTRFKILSKAALTNYLSHVKPSVPYEHSDLSRLSAPFKLSLMHYSRQSRKTLWICCCWWDWLCSFSRSWGTTCMSPPPLHLHTPKSKKLTPALYHSDSAKTPLKCNHGQCSEISLLACEHSGSSPSLMAGHRTKPSLLKRDT